MSSDPAAPAAFPCITIEGPAQQRGRQYGQTAGEYIARAITAYRQEFESSGVSWPQACDLAASFFDIIRNYDVQMSEELQGIAQGAEQSLEAVVALNARTELMFWKGRERLARVTGAARGQDASAEMDECTGFVALGQITAGGRVLHGQNWDWRPAALQFAIVLRVITPDRPALLTFVEAGQLARHGFNDRGIALTASGLHSDQDYGRMGVPSPLMRRRVLLAPDLGDAIGTVLRSQRAFSHNIFLSHSDGEAAGFETTPDAAFWHLPEDGLLVHANHFRHPAALARITDLGLLRTPESLYRYRRVREGLHRARGSVSLQHIQTVLADRFGAPNAVCRSPAQRPGGATSATIASLIMDARAGKMWVVPAPYAGASYTEYSLDASA